MAIIAVTGEHEAKRKQREEEAAPRTGTDRHGPGKITDGHGPGRPGEEKKGRRKKHRSPHRGRMNAPAARAYRPAKDCARPVTGSATPKGVVAILVKRKDPNLPEEERPRLP